MKLYDFTERHSRKRHRGSILPRAAALLTALQFSAFAALPTPVVEMRFSEGTGVSTANAGSLGGSGEFVQANNLPAFSSNVPTGRFAPANNTQSVDFGTIAAGQGGRAIDLFTSSGTLGALPAITISGWLNPRDLTIGAGGNRILFALETANGAGVDLVQLANGSLRLGVNQFPDGAGGGGPSSSANRLRANAQAASTNWVFFAVTYDPALPSQNVKYYFGNAEDLAALDTAHNYRGGMPDTEGRIDFTGTPTIGNFSEIIAARTATGNTGSRSFRGLMDELKIYDTALDLAEIQSAQLNGAVPVAPVVIQQQPANRTVFEGQRATMQVRVTGAAPFTYQWQRNGANIPEATNDVFVIERTTLADNSAVFSAVVGNASGSTNTQNATLTVLAESGHKVSLSFSDGGSLTTNLGNLGGAGRLVLGQGFPAFSGNVPAGQFAPSGNVSSINFGTIGAGQGGRAIDVTNNFGNTMGPMEAFTISGWVNARDLQVGPGGNRIAFALSTGNGPGFDLVHLADGSLQIGVNQWPDGTPARSGPILTADPDGSAANWVFFAVTYDGTRESDNVSFYVGSPGEQARLESTATYTRGPILTSGSLTVGNFGTVVAARTETGSASRVLRGFLDELNIHNRALTLEQIQAQQRAPAYAPAQVSPVSITQQPANLLIFERQTANFTVLFSGTPPSSVQWQRNGVSISGETNQILSLPATLADNDAEFRAIIANSAGSVTSQVARLTVKPDTGRKIALSFSENSGTNTVNSGDLEGLGTFVIRNEFPVFSSRVPVGPSAPANNSSSIDFGAIEAGQGGRAIDFTNIFGNTLGPFDAFTITGWLNSRDLRVGSGGNRIVFGLASGNGPGLDLVQMSDGSLQLGVNQWPDNTPARSSAGMITEDSATGAENWVFFAVAYDGTRTSDNLQYFFGNPSQPAQPDAGPLTYNRGRIVTSGPLTVGNFGTIVGARNDSGPTSSRVFRGLMDEIQIFTKALTLEEIQNAQKAPAHIASVAAPSLAVSRSGNELVISWESSANFQLQSATALSPPWTEVTAPVEQNGNRRTVRVPLEGSTRFFRLFRP